MIMKTVQMRLKKEEARILNEVLSEGKYENVSAALRNIVNEWYCIKRSLEIINNPKQKKKLDKAISDSKKGKTKPLSELGKKLGI